jgi:hypothetical protein
MSTGGSSVLFGTGGVLDIPCRSPDAGAPVFAAQVAALATSGARELFSWTTDEQIAELRRDRVLLTREERPGLGPGFAMDTLAQRALSASDEAPVLNRVLELFKKVRYAWTNPWATRMGWEGESYGNQLIRILLREDAWIMSINGGAQGVTDLAGRAVPVEAVRATPERIGALFFSRDGSSGGPTCGSFTDGSNGYREFIVGNEAMVEEWSIGTDALHDRLTSDAALLARFFDRIRGCPEGSDPVKWNRDVVCSWRDVPTRGDETTFYEAALSMPSSAYFPSPGNISTLIDTLSADAAVMGAPLVVRPGK